MKKQALAWLFFIISCNILLYSSSETNQQPMITEEKQLKSVERIKKSYKGVHIVLRSRDIYTENKFNESIHSSGHKGKGVYGGGDQRPRSKKRSAANSLLPKSSSLSSLLRYASTFGMLIFLFFF